MDVGCSMLIVGMLSLFAICKQWGAVEEASPLPPPSEQRQQEEQQQHGSDDGNGDGDGQQGGVRAYKDALPPLPAEQSAARISTPLL